MAGLVRGGPSSSVMWSRQAVARKLHFWEFGWLLVTFDLLYYNVWHIDIRHNCFHTKHAKWEQNACKMRTKYIFCMQALMNTSLCSSAGITMEKWTNSISIYMQLFVINVNYSCKCWNNRFREPWYAACGYLWHILPLHAFNWLDFLRFYPWFHSLSIRAITLHQYGAHRQWSERAMNQGTSHRLAWINFLHVLLGNLMFVRKRFSPRNANYIWLASWSILKSANEVWKWL